MNLNEAIGKSVSQNGGTCEFVWNEVEHTWCLCGSTRDGLYWETDDVEAEGREQAEAEAISYLIEHNDL